MILLVQKFIPHMKVHIDDYTAAFNSIATMESACLHHSIAK